MRGLSTAAVFKHFDVTVQAPPAADMPPAQLLAALEAGDVAEVSRHIRNDLQATAIELRPELGQLIDLAKKAGALAAMVLVLGLLWPPLAPVARRLSGSSMLAHDPLLRPGSYRLSSASNGVLTALPYGALTGAP